MAFIYEIFTQKAKLYLKLAYTQLQCHRLFLLQFVILAYNRPIHSFEPGARSLVLKEL